MNEPLEENLAPGIGMAALGRFGGIVNIFRGYHYLELDMNILNIIHRKGLP